MFGTALDPQKLLRFGTDPQNLLRFGTARSAKAATFWHEVASNVVNFPTRSAKATTFWHEAWVKNPLNRPSPIRKSCYVLAPIRKSYYVLAPADPQKLLRFRSRSAKAATFWIAIRKSCYVLDRGSAEAATFWIAIRKSCYVLDRGYFRGPRS